MLKTWGKQHRRQTHNIRDIKRHEHDAELVVGVVAKDLQQPLQLGIACVATVEAAVSVTSATHKAERYSSAVSGRIKLSSLSSSLRSALWSITSCSRCTSWVFSDDMVGVGVQAHHPNWPLLYPPPAQLDMSHQHLDPLRQRKTQVNNSLAKVSCERSRSRGCRVKLSQDVTVLGHVRNKQLHNSQKYNHNKQDQSPLSTTPPG